jgi:hypothetical protein
MPIVGRDAGVGILYAGCADGAQDARNGLI